MPKPQARKIRLAPNKNAWAQQFKPPQVKGTPLYVSVAISARYYAKLKPLIDRMARETRDQLIALFTHPSFAEDGYTEDASIASQARILTNGLTDKFTKLFGGVAQQIATDTVQQTDDNSASTLKGSLKDLSGGVTFKTDFVSEGVNDAITASIASNVDLIKRIPEAYMSDITGATMRAITLGNGLQDLKPYLSKKYQGTARQAELMCMDQVRKAYTSINTERMKSVGVSKFEWIHSGGSQHPREYHSHVLNGNVYDMDDPPVIDERTGEKGLPGQLPNCRCTMRPIVSFDD